MKNILNTLLKKPAPNNLNSRLSWLSQIADLDEVNTISLATKHITSVLNDASLVNSEKSNLIFTIDETCRHIASSQTKLFAKADHLKADIANALYDKNYAYHRTLFLTYYQIIESSFNKVTDQQPSNHLKKTLIANALTAAINMLKWRYFTHATAPANIWIQSHTLYAYAAQHLVEKLPLDTSDNVKPTITNLYHALLMLGSINFNNFNSQQIELASELLNLWMPSLYFKKEMASFHTFYVDIQKDMPAARIRKNTPAGVGYYWNLDDIEITIDKAVIAITAHKQPDFAAHLGVINLPLLSSTLHFLKSEWGKKGYKRQRRKETRQDTGRNATVSVGIAAISTLLKQMNFDTQSVKSLLEGSFNDRRLNTSVVMRGTTNTLVVGKDKWTILNESDLGLGTLIPQENNANVKPNQLVASLIKFPETKPIIGVVRNIKQMAGGKLKIGIEVFTDKPNLAMLKKFDIKKAKEDQTPHKDETVSPLGNVDFLGIYIPANTLLGQAASIIIPKIEFIPNSFYQIAFNKKRELINLKDIIELGDDWVRLSFPEDF